MAYTDEEEITAGKVATFGVVSAAVIGFLAALAVAMTSTAIKQKVKDMASFDVKEEQEPEKPPPPPPEKNNLPPPPVVTAPKPVNAPPPLALPPAPPPPPAPTPPPPPLPPPPAAPPPAPPAKAQRATPKGAPGSWATTDDYPSSALRAEEQGVTGFRVEVGVDGRVTSCSVTSSSGSSTLDEATCRLVTRRARFKPAIGADGQPTTDTYSNRVRWQIPKD